MAKAGFLHRFEQADRTCHIILVIRHRPRYRLAHGLKPREVKHGIEPMRREQVAQSHAIADVQLRETRSAPCYFFDAIDYIGPTVAEIVDNVRFKACVLQFDHRMRSDIAGTAGNKDSGNVRHE